MDTAAPAEPYTVKISREIPIPYFILTLPNGHTEEMEPEDTRTFFRVRGANMDVVERALDYVWNFGSYKPVYLAIKNYREQVVVRGRTTPEV